MVVTYSSPSQTGGRGLQWTPKKESSPSRQLQSELERALQQLAIHDVELRKVHAYERRSFQEELEARDVARTKADLAQIELAARKHEAIRREAEAVLERHMREQEEERRRKEIEERERVEREAKAKAQREQRAREEADRKAREEQERKAAVVAREKKAAEDKARAEAERREREAQDERDRIEKERLAKDKANREAADAAATAAARAQTERDAAQKALSQKQPASTPQISRPTSRYHSSSPEAEARHHEYLDLHKKLKQFRTDFWGSAKSNKQFKSRVGDMRRLIRASVGQQSLSDKNNNKLVTQKVKATLNEALKQLPSPPTPVNDFLPSDLQVPDATTTVPSLVVYLLSILAKSIINAITTECVADTKAAEAIGTMTAQIFSMPELSFPRPGLSPDHATLIPILMAKYHKIAPILFGISGTESTSEGRFRLGWRTQDQGNGKVFVTEKQHYERMNALGAGYASIALRNFSKARLRNPYPPACFWTSLANITNTPPQHVTTSHLLLLKSMLENNAVDRFILFFGSTAIGALRVALVDFPSQLPQPIQQGSAARAITIMLEQWAKDKHFRLD